MWNIKYDTNELMEAADTQAQRTDLWLPRWKAGGGMDWEFGTGRCKLVYTEYINTRSYCVSQETTFNIL